ncbi:MAG: hypothetical protein ACREBE_29760 [bacterium]
MPFVPGLLASGLLLMGAQVPDRPPSVTEGASAPENVYGTPEPAEIADLVAGALSHRPVVVKGVIGILEAGRYYSLQDGISRLTVVPFPELADSLARFAGTRVEVTGYVRELVEDQGTCRFRGNRNAPQSLCDDPVLPPKPDLTSGRATWPRTSITVWRIVDASPSSRKATPADDASAVSGAPGERVHLRGQFGGANLAHAVSSAPPTADAWILTVEDAAVWVIGKAPRGSGFQLDPTYRGDLGKWLEVEGRMATCPATPCLKATKIRLSTPPDKDPPP